MPYSMPNSKAEHTRRPSQAAALGLLWFAVILIFFRIVSHPFEGTDDRQYILQNPQIVAPGDATLAELLIQPHIGYLVPLTGLLEAALYAMGSGQPWIFHLTSLLLHGLVVTLAFLLFGALGLQRVVAFFAAMVFAVHPVVVEPVAWAIGLKDLCMSLLILTGSWLLVRECRDLPQGGSRWRLVTVGLCGLLAVLAKPTAALVGCAWAAYLVSRRLAGQHTPRGAPLMVTALLGLAALLTFMSTISHQAMLVRSHSDLSTGSWLPLLALGYQIHHLVFPDLLVPRYPEALRNVGFADIHTWIGALALPLILLVAYRFRKDPVRTLGLALAVCTHAPVSNLIPTPRMFADSYLYIPLLGLLLVLAPGAQALLNRLRPGVYHMSLAGMVVVTVVLGALSFRQVGRWRSPVSLWYPAVKTFGDWDYGWMQIANGLDFLGEHERARRVYEQLYARHYAPEFFPLLVENLHRLGDLDEAECVLLEELNHGVAVGRAAKTLGVLLLRYPNRPLVHPAEVRAALAWALSSEVAGRLEWPVEFRQRLARILGQLRKITAPEPPPSWPRRNCLSLRAARLPWPP